MRSCPHKRCSLSHQLKCISSNFSRLLSIVPRLHPFPAPMAKIGKPAPDFAAQAVVDGEVKELKLSSYFNKGKYIVL